MPITDHALTIGGPTAAASRYAVSLVDRRTGRPHLISGIPLVVMTCQPGKAARELMHDRDTARWDARIEPINRKGAVQ